MGAWSDFKDRVAEKILERAANRFGSWKSLEETEQSLEVLYAMMDQNLSRQEFDTVMAMTIRNGAKLYAAGAEVGLIDVFAKIASARTVTSDDLNLLAFQYGVRIGPSGWDRSVSDDELAAFKSAWAQADEQGDIGNRSLRGLAAAFRVRSGL